MITKSLRLPEDMLASIEMVERKEHIEEAGAIRKLIRIGLEAYLAALYRQGRVSLREFASQLHLSQTEAIDTLLEHGVSGNLEADDILHSLESLK